MKKAPSDPEGPSGLLCCFDQRAHASKTPAGVLVVVVRVSVA
jgi:hypothetical protein